MQVYLYTGWGRGPDWSSADRINGLARTRIAHVTRITASEHAELPPSVSEGRLVKVNVTVVPALIPLTAKRSR